jgi:hypothetical protein
MDCRCRCAVAGAALARFGFIELAAFQRSAEFQPAMRPASGETRVWILYENSNPSQQSHPMCSRVIAALS